MNKRMMSISETSKAFSANIFMDKISEIIGYKEMVNLKFWRAVFGEFVVSLIYVVMACGVGLHVPPTPQPSILHIGLTVGLTVAILAATFWNISGGHFNPAVTVGLAVMGKVPVIRCILYVMAQCAGSAAGAGLLYAYLPPVLRGNLGALALNKNISAGYGLMLEITLTYQFILCVAASTDPANNFTGFQAPLAIGLSVGTGLLVCIPFTGGALNPIRAFGPAVVMDQRKDHWVYWIGPITGGILATLSYKYVFSERVVAEEDTTDAGHSATVVVRNESAYEHGRNESNF